jgi:excalibur calcium-binding domain-containing protein
MRSIVGAVAVVVALCATGCGSPPASGTHPLAPATTTTVAPPAPVPVETPLPAPPVTTTTRAPQPIVPPVAKPKTTTEAPPAPAPVYYANCTAAKAAGAAPIHRGEPGYRPALDRDNDGIACE